jgi:hypothetical protein
MRGRRRPRRMTPERADLILHVLGWRRADLCRRMNRLAGTTYRSGDVWKWFSGVRGLPLPVAVFLRLSLRNAVLSRRLARLSSGLAVPGAMPRSRRG